MMAELSRAEVSLNSMVAGQKLNPRYSTVHGGWRGWPEAESSL